MNNLVRYDCQGDSVLYDQTSLDLTGLIVNGGLGLDLIKGSSCLEKNNPFMLMDIDINFLFASTRIDSYSFLSPSYFIRDDDYTTGGNFHDYLQAHWVKGFRASEIDNETFKGDYNEESCPSVCVGNLPCLRKSFNEQYYACVPSSTDIITGCESVGNDDLFYLRCLAIKNISYYYKHQSNQNVDDILSYLSEFELSEDLSSPAPFDDTNYSEEQLENLADNTYTFFNEYFEKSFDSDNSVTGVDQSDLNILEQFTFDDYSVDSQLNCYESNYLNVDGVMFNYPIPLSTSSDYKRKFYENDGPAGSDVQCVKEGTSLEVVRVGISCRKGVVEFDEPDDQSDCLKHEVVEFDCTELNPRFHVFVDSTSGSDVETETELRDGTKFYFIAPGIVRIDSFRDDSSASYASLDVLDDRSRSGEDQYGIQRSYILFDDLRNTDFSSFMFNRYSFINSSNRLNDITESHSGNDKDDLFHSYHINREILDTILSSYKAQSPQLEGIVEKLLERETYKDNQLAQKYAACFVADYLFTDFEGFDPPASVASSDELSCYLDSTKNAVIALERVILEPITIYINTTQAMFLEKKKFQISMSVTRSS